ncbi:MAG: glycosyltransferase family 39 protein [Candidatus Saccharimonadales bacterium]
MKSLGLLAVIAGGVFGLFIWQLGSLTPGMSPAEKAAAFTSQSPQIIADNSLYGPFKLLQYVLNQTGLSQPFSLRLASVIFALMIIASFYTIVKAWFGRIVGLLSTLLLVGTPLLLVSARQTTPEVMYLAPVILMAAYYWLLRTQKHYKIAWVLLIATAALCLYVPGLVWWVLAGVITARRRLFSAFKKMPRSLTIGAVVLAIVLVAPLILAISENPSILRVLALLPETLPEPLTAIKSIGWMFLALVWQAPYHYPLIIDRLPTFNMILIALSIFGMYAMWTNARNKTYALASTIGFSIIASGLNQNPALLIFSLPAVTVFAAAGLRYLHVEWNSIFPYNPLPRFLAIVLMLALVTAHMFLGIRYGLVAWPRSLDTQHLYVLQ